MSSSKKKAEGIALIESLIAVVVGGILVGTAALVISVMLRVSQTDRHVQVAWFQNQSALEAAASIIETNWAIGYGAVTDVYSQVVQQVYGTNSLPPLTDPLYFSANINEFQGYLSCTQSGGDPQICFSQYITATCGNALCYSPCTANLINQLYSVEVDGTEYYTCFDVMSVVRQTGNNALTNFATHGFGPDPTGTIYADSSTIRLSVKTRWGANLQFETPPLHRYITRSRNRVFHQTDWSFGPTDPIDNPIPEPRHFFYSENGINYSTPGEITKEP